MIDPTPSDTERERLELRYADLTAINEAQQRLKAARRSVHLANLKRARREARVQRALRDFEDSIREIEVAEAALKVAQQTNDRVFMDAVTHRLAEEAHKVATESINQLQSDPPTINQVIDQS